MEVNTNTDIFVQITELQRQALDAINNQDLIKAKIFIEQIDSLNHPIPNTNVIKALYELYSNNITKSKQLLREELKIFAGNLQAQTLYQNLISQSDFTALEDLSCDLPNLITPEIIRNSNDFYGHATAIKEYCDIDNKYPLKAVIEHVSGFGGGFICWDLDAQAPCRYILVSSENRKKAFADFTDQKKLVAIGPIILYAKSFLPPELIQEEKKRLGRNVLFYPSHSSAHWTAKYDIEKTISLLKDLSKEFESIRISMYWKDILLGTHKEYQKAGFECVSSGHVHDVNFIKRQRSLIEISDIVMTNSPTCACIANALALNKPVFLTNRDENFIKNDPSFQCGHYHIKSISEETKQAEIARYHEETLNLLGRKIDLNITQEIRDYGNHYFGLNAHLDKAKMRDLLFQCEIEYNLMQRS